MVYHQDSVNVNMFSGPYPTLRFKRIVSTIVMDARRFFTQKPSSEASMSQKTKKPINTKYNQKIVIKKHMSMDYDVGQPDFLSDYLRQKRLKAQNKLGKKPRPSDPRDSDSLKAPRKSPTSEWLSTAPSTPMVVPKECSFSGQANDPGYYQRPLGPPRKHTAEARKKAEVVLTTSVPMLAHHVTSDMMEMIEKSPLVTRGKDVIVLRSDRFRTKVHNRRECYILLARFLRNVASEIVYREERIAAEDEKRHKLEEGNSGNSSE